MSLTKYSKRAKIRPLPTTEWEWDQRKLIKAQKNQNNSRNNGGNDSQSTSSSPQLLRVLELEKMGKWLTGSSPHLHCTFFSLVLPSLEPKSLPPQ